MFVLDLATKCVCSTNLEGLLPVANRAVTTLAVRSLATCETQAHILAHPLTQTPQRGMRPRPCIPHTLSTAWPARLGCGPYCCLGRGRRAATGFTQIQEAPSLEDEGARHPQLQAAIHTPNKIFDSALGLKLLPMTAPSSSSTFLASSPAMIGCRVQEAGQRLNLQPLLSPKQGHEVQPCPCLSALSVLSVERTDNRQVLALSSPPENRQRCAERGPTFVPQAPTEALGY